MTCWLRVGYASDGVQRRTDATITALPNIPRSLSRLQTKAGSCGSETLFQQRKPETPGDDRSELSKRSLCFNDENRKPPVLTVPPIHLFEQLSYSSASAHSLAYPAWRSVINNANHWLNSDRLRDIRSANVT